MAKKQRETRGWSTLSEKHEKETIDNHQKAFEACNLTADQLRGFPMEMKLEYMQRAIAAKYHKPCPKITCYSCAHDILFKDSGYISDDDMLEIAGSRFQPA